MSFVLVSCNETTTPNNNTKPKPNAPTNLRATSKAADKIILKWNLSTSESDSKFTGYILEIAPGTFLPQKLQKGIDTYMVTGLTEGTVYTFKVYSVMDSVESDTAASVDWSPATRFDTTSSGNPIRVYETASDFGSGLDLYDEVDHGPKTYTVANGAKWNLALDTRTSGQIIVASPNQVDYNYGTQPGVTEISNKAWENASSLDDVFDSDALNTGTFLERSYDLEKDFTTNIGVVLVLRTKEGTNLEYTYAKVLIKKVNGSWLQGPLGNRYIECVVSYQKTPGVPFAL